MFRVCAGFVPSFARLLAELERAEELDLVDELHAVLLSGTAPEQSGLASGVQNTTRQTGALMSVSILGAVLNAQAMSSRLGVAFGVLAAVVVLAIGVAALSLRAGPATRRL